MYFSSQLSVFINSYNPDYIGILLWVDKNHLINFNYAELKCLLLITYQISILTLRGLGASAKLSVGGTVDNPFKILLTRSNYLLTSFDLSYIMVISGQFGFKGSVGGEFFFLGFPIQQSI